MRSVRSKAACVRRYPPKHVHTNYGPFTKCYDVEPSSVSQVWSRMVACARLHLMHSAIIEPSNPSIKSALTECQSISRNGVRLVFPSTGEAPCLAICKTTPHLAWEYRDRSTQVTLLLTYFSFTCTKVRKERVRIPGNYLYGLSPVPGIRFIEATE